MIEDTIVIDATVHAYNITKENRRPAGERLMDRLWAYFTRYQPPEYQRLTREQFEIDVSVELMARTVFLESDVDFVVCHRLPLFSWFDDGICSHDKNVEMMQRYPQRFAAYAGVDGTQGAADCIEALERQVEDIPSIRGLKLYPAQIDPYRFFRMDDPELFVLYERAQELGIKVIAVHKAQPQGPIPMNPFKIDDVEGAAMAFPDLNFEIVHAGVIFAEETAHAIARYGNVYANLEVTSSMAYTHPGMFEDVIARFIRWGGVEKLFYSAGALWVHPQPFPRLLWDLTFSEATMYKYGIGQITPEQKAMILSGSYAKMHGLDLDQVRGDIADDEFARERRATGRQEPYSNWLSML